MLGSTSSFSGVFECLRVSPSVFEGLRRSPNVFACLSVQHCGQGRTCTSSLQKEVARMSPGRIHGTRYRVDATYACSPYIVKTLHMHGALYRQDTVRAWRCSYSLAGGLRDGKMALVRNDHSHQQSDTNSVKLDATKIRYVTTGHNMWGHTDRRELLKSNYLKYCTVRQTMLFSSSGASFLKLDTSRSCRRFVRDLQILKMQEKL